MVNTNINRDKLIIDLINNGVEANIGAYALHMIKYFQEKYFCSPIQISLAAHPGGGHDGGTPGVASFYNLTRFSNFGS